MCFTDDAAAQSDAAAVVARLSLTTFCVIPVNSRLTAERPELGQTISELSPITLASTED